MAIEYNQNMKTTFNNYIDTAVSNLKKAGTEAGCILNFTFPSKTIIGRRFNKKSQISTLKENINSSYTTLSTIKSDVQKQVNAYKKANEAVMNITDSLDLSLTGAMGSLFGNLSKKDKQINNLNWAPSYMQGNQSNNANTDGFNWAASYQGGITPTGGYKGYSKYSFNDFWTDLKRTGATVINGFTALSEGATEMFFGGGDRAIELGGRAIASPYYALKDAWIYATSRGKKKGENLKNAWDSTMDFVADKSLVEKQHIAEHQQESYKEFDKYVYEPLKYGKSGYSIFKSLGGILGAATGPSVITGAPVITTAGISAKFIPTLSTGLTSGARGTSEYWQGKKSNSMQGIKDSYLLGEITEEQYKNIIGIRNISDEEWKKIEKSMTKKGIDKNSPEYQQYLEMKKIREIPENWKNKETLFGGLKYGGATAAWEMAQFTIGGNLSDFVESPFARIAINTGLNSADPVVRASFMSQIDKTSFLKEFEKQGGIGAVLTSGAVGLLGSTIGEWAEFRARRQKKYVFEEDGNNGFSMQSGNERIQSTNEAILNNNNNKVFENINNDKLRELFESSGLSKNQLYMENPEDKGLIINEIANKYSFEDISTMDDNMLNSIVIRAKKDASINLIVDYTRNKKKFFSADDIKDTIENHVVLYNSLQEMQESWLASAGYTEAAYKKYRSVGAFCDSNGNIHLPPNAPIRNIVHEVNHTKGSVKPEVVHVFDRGNNEALTELLAIKITGSPNKSGYDKSVEIMGKIVDGLEKSGYKDIDYHTYFGKDRQYLRKVLDERVCWEINDQKVSFYETLGYHMDIYNETYDNPILKESASRYLDTLLEYFNTWNNYQRKRTILDVIMNR